MTQNPFSSTLKNHAGKLLLVLGIISLLWLYLKPTPSSNTKALECQTFSQEPKLQSFAKGSMHHLQIKQTPAPLPELKFIAPNGHTITQSHFTGRFALLNLWATWCPPCRAEMPSLDNLQDKAGDDLFEVVAINIDTRADARVGDFLEHIKIKHLNFYKEQTAQIFQTLKASGHARGLPITILIDKKGCEIARLSGATHWDSPEFLALIDHLKKQ